MNIQPNKELTGVESGAGGGGEIFHVLGIWQAHFLAARQIALRLR